MSIEVELDPVHAERLAYLQKKLQKAFPEVLADVIDLALAKLDQTYPLKPSVWEARTHFEQKHGALTEEFYLPPLEIDKATWRNPL